jgi:hypothetical protein
MFLGAKFGGLADFTRAHFSGVTVFGQASPKKEFKALFVGAARFDDAEFDSPAVFDNVIFKSESSFAGAQFGKIGSFAGTVFYRPAIFASAHCVGYLIFHTETNSPARVYTARFDDLANFDDIEVGDVASFQGVEFQGDVRFLNARFRNDAYFPGTIFDRNAFFDRVQIFGVALFNRRVPHKLRTTGRQHARERKDQRKWRRRRGYCRRDT